MTWVTPSPESMTVPVSDLSVTLDDVQEAARARTACTAIYMPAQLKDSKKISAVFSRFSGGFNGFNVLVLYLDVGGPGERLTGSVRRK